MDIVIPFVNCKDKVWVKTYLSLNKHIEHNPISYKYYYDYGTLKYVFRGIDKYIDYVNNIFLIVSNIEQVPDYIDQSKIKVVLHKDFILEEYLPTFNSCTIEMFIHRIPGLGEEFVYIQDDMIPVSTIPYEKLFKDGLPCLNFIENNTTQNTPIERNINISFGEAMNTASELLKKQIEYDGISLWPNHGPTSLLKSVCENAASISRHQRLLEYYISTFRRLSNLNQYYWCDILYFMNKYTPSVLKLKYITAQNIDNLNIVDTQNNYQFICINDSILPNEDEKYTMCEIHTITDNKLNTIFPDKSRYEK